MSIDHLKFKKYPVLDNGFICLVDAMGNDASIVQAARVSYGNDELVPERIACDSCNLDWGHGYCGVCGGRGTIRNPEYGKYPEKDRNLIRYLMSHQHTTPFEMVELKFMVQVPMDCWRQWIRHRTANVNEYSTRYTEAIDICQTTKPTEWRLQATDNKQGSSGFLEEEALGTVCGRSLSEVEEWFHRRAKDVYHARLEAGVAKEQARKDLPLSTYTRAYWKCDLHNIFNFLRLRMDSHAQYEIRMYANAMYEIVKQVVPVACEAFEDYILNGCRMSAMEMNLIRAVVSELKPMLRITNDKPTGMTDREWNEFKKKVGI